MSKRHRQARQTEKVPTARLLNRERDVPAMLGYLKLVRSAHAELDELQDDWVRGLLACGVGYAEIALALGVSRQVVHRRYAGTVHAAKPNADGSVTWTDVGAK